MLFKTCANLSPGSKNVQNLKKIVVYLKLIGSIVLLIVRLGRRVRSASNGVLYQLGAGA